ncbi:MAG TPA: lysophospholipid acyltransferase family protein [Anaerolineae bacterium]|nr:lysophospholipid acyltransferase family protein [Anaerolineae bacterium]HQH37584.1 lysophospholipid acyltransferase family protein [Anaerolineae bacterium]
MENYWKMRTVIAWLFRLVAHVEVMGAEHIPMEGGCLLVLNHISRLDTPLLLIASPRRIYPLVADKYKTFPVFNWLLGISEAIWINRSEFDRNALLKSIDVLKRGDVLGIAPEGTRSPDGVLRKAKPGVAFLAARTGATIVPAGITGTASMLHDFLRLRRMQIRVTFGESFRLPKYGRLSADELAAATDMIMARVAALLPPIYRGVYAATTAQI